MAGTKGRFTRADALTEGMRVVTENGTTRVLSAQLVGRVVLVATEDGVVEVTPGFPFLVV